MAAARLSEVATPSPLATGALEQRPPCSCHSGDPHSCSGAALAAVCRPACLGSGGSGGGGGSDFVTPAARTAEHHAAGGCSSTCRCCSSTAAAPRFLAGELSGGRDSDGGGGSGGGSPPTYAPGGPDLELMTDEMHGLEDHRAIFAELEAALESEQAKAARAEARAAQLEGELDRALKDMGQMQKLMAKFPGLRSQVNRER